MKFFSLLYQGDVHPSTDEKVIKKEDYSTLVSAVELLEKAQADADKLLEKTKQECKKLKEQAKQKGFDEGLEQFNEHILKMNADTQALQHKLQQMVLPIALKAAKRIVGKQLDLSPETILDIVKQALAPVSENRKVILFVNKEDKEILDKNKPELLELLSQVESFVIQEKPDIEKGGCIIQTESGMINATIENQWKALERAFAKYQP